MSGVTYLTFKCGACGKFNAVGEELRGQKVRCPHCQQVVTVPGGNGEPQTPAPANDLSFTIRAAETDSILTTTEGVGDVLFDEEMPTATLQMPVAEPSLDEGATPAVQEIGAEAEVEHATEATPATQAPPLEGSSPFTDSEPDSEAATTATPAAPPDADVAGLGHATEENPWADASLSRAGLSETAAPPVEAADLSLPVPATKPSASSWVLAILLPYALAATAAAVIFFLRSGGEVVHPLDSLRDQGLYEALPEGRQERVDPRQPLGPDARPIALGETRVVGDLEVTPLRVARQQLRYETYRGAANFQKDEDALFLHLRIKNRSDRLVFHPNDATFNRTHAPDSPSYTYVEVDGRPYYGPMPVEETNFERLKGQNLEELLPGGTMETVVVATEPSAAARGDGPRNVLEALRTVSSDQELIWRVQLRKGREKVRLQRGGQREVWVTTVIPIRFTPAEVRAGP